MSAYTALSTFSTGPSDGVVNLGFATVTGINLVLVGYSVYGLMGNVPKIGG
jgi:hypothetical protein